jgi:hypothetical protein
MHRYEWERTSNPLCVVTSWEVVYGQCGSTRFDSTLRTEEKINPSLSNM